MLNPYIDCLVNYNEFDLLDRIFWWLRNLILLFLTLFFKLYYQIPCPHITDPAEKYLSLIVPAYNEELRLPAALEETMDYLQDRASRDKSFSFEVVIVDDGSVDGTKRVAFDFIRKYTIDNIRVIPLGKNQGKGEAIRKH